MDEPAHVADLADYEAIRPAFQGVESVVHLAAASEVDSSWDAVLGANIVGTRNVFEAAREAGAAQVVFASSNHVIGMYEKDGAPAIYEADDGRVYDEHVDLRPDSPYGVSKAFGEALGRYYSDVHGVRVICLRIGMVGRDDRPPKRPRTRAIWLSHRDCAQLFGRALEADDLRFAICYGISNNARQLWDLRSARELLGYQPEDGAPA